MALRCLRMSNKLKADAKCIYACGLSSKTEAKPNI